MATVSTASPTVNKRPQIPPTADDDTISGKIDLSDLSGWSFVASFVFPTPHFQFTYQGGDNTLDITAGRVARTEDDGQYVIDADAVTGLALNSSTVHYVFFRDDNVIEVEDGDNPPSGDALLMGTVDSGAGTVDEAVRGRTPVSQFPTL